MHRIVAQPRSEAIAYPVSLHLFPFILLCLACFQVFSTVISLPKAGSAFLGLPPWLPWAAAGMRAWSREPLSPINSVLRCASQPLSGCAFVCMETRIQGEEEGRTTGASLFLPPVRSVSWLRCCRHGDGGYKVGTQGAWRRGLPHCKAEYVRV